MNKIITYSSLIIALLVSSNSLLGQAAATSVEECLQTQFKGCGKNGKIGRICCEALVRNPKITEKILRNLHWYLYNAQDYANGNLNQPGKFAFQGIDGPIYPSISMIKGGVCAIDQWDRDSSYPGVDLETVCTPGDCTDPMSYTKTLGPNSQGDTITYYTVRKCDDVLLIPGNVVKQISETIDTLRPTIIRLEESICPGKSTTFKGKEVNEGVHYDVTDTIITIMHVTQLPYLEAKEEIIIPSDSFYVNREELYLDGIYTEEKDTFLVDETFQVLRKNKDKYECDSLVTISIEPTDTIPLLKCQICEELWRKFQGPYAGGEVQLTSRTRNASVQITDPNKILPGFFGGYTFKKDRNDPLSKDCIAYSLGIEGGGFKSSQTFLQREDLCLGCEPNEPDLSSVTFYLELDPRIHVLPLMVRERGKEIGIDLSLGAKPIIFYTKNYSNLDVPQVYADLELSFMIAWNKILGGIPTMIYLETTYSVWSLGSRRWGFSLGARGYPFSGEKSPKK